MQTKQILEKFEPRRENLLMILHAIQDSHPNNYISEEALTETADYLKLTKSSVYGVAKYYTMFSLEPRGKYIIRVCLSTVCELMHGRGVIAQLEKMLGIKPGETTPCKTFTLEVSECLGHCQDSPGMMINQEVYGRLDEEKIREIITRYRKW